MTKLKTLEDLKTRVPKGFSKINGLGFEGMKNYVRRNDLKREATKDLINIYELEKILQIKLNDKIVVILSKYIMWKNILTEGDLK